MIQELMLLIPQSLNSEQLLICTAGVLAGAMLWLMGAVWSRAIVTLIAVAAGGLAGELLPRWYILPVNSMAMAVLGATLCGVCAAMIPRLWVGLVLGVVLCAWAAFGCWVLLRGDAVWQLRQDWEIQTMNTPQYVQDLWQRLPDPVQRVLPYAAATALISALSLNLLWPRVGRVFMCSATGLTMMLVFGLTLIDNRASPWLKFIPPEPAMQILTLSGVFLLGMLIQWQLLPNKREERILKEERRIEPKLADKGL